MRNYGVTNAGGSVTIKDSVLGSGNTVVQAASDSNPLRPERGPACNLGILTVLACESQAMTAELHKLGTCRHETQPDGYRFHDVTVRGETHGCRLVATRTTNKGQKAASASFTVLRERYRPAVTALVGIAGSISRAATVGDVVIGVGVIDYEPRKELPGTIRRRGNQLNVPEPIRRAVNDYFDEHGEPHVATVEDPDGVRRTFKIVTGLIGSGEAVIADSKSSVRKYLSDYSDQVIAVETEAAGLATAFQEYVASTPGAVGWLTVRGISDQADVTKADDHQAAAAYHAALVLTWLLPYLAPLRGR